jgi:hypothetical protein
MDSGLLVFLAGTALTYPAIYWMLSHALARRSRTKTPRQTSDESATRRAFLQTLRDEARARVGVVLLEAVEELRRFAAADGHATWPSTADSLARIAEARVLTASLLTRTEIAQFDRIAARIAAGDVAQIELIAAGIERLRQGLGTGTGWKRIPQALGDRLRPWLYPALPPKPSVS